jgi:cytochrome c
MKSTLAMAVLAVSATALMTQGAQAAGDPTAGEHVFRICMACHAIGPGAKNKVGPELNGIDGRHSGTAPGYSYSEANKKSGIVWNEQTFKKYIHDPRAMIPGTKMIFPGIKNAKQVDDLWAYVSQFGPDGKTK